MGSYTKYMQVLEPFFNNLDPRYSYLLTKSVGMLSSIISFYDLCQKAIADSPTDSKLTYVHIKTALGPIIQKVIDGKYVDPKSSVQEINKFYCALNDDLKQEFLTLTDGM